MPYNNLDLIDITKLAPPFALDGSDYTEPTVGTEDFRSALRTYLLSLTELAGLDAIYWSSSPSGADMPYMVISRLWQRTNVVTTAVYYKEAAYQFTIISMDDEEAETLGQSAHDALLPLADAEEIAFTGGYEMTRIPGQNRGPDAQNTGMVGGDKVWIYSFDYTWLLGIR